MCGFESAVVNWFKSYLSIAAVKNVIMVTFLIIARHSVVRDLTISSCCPFIIIGLAMYSRLKN